MRFDLHDSARIVLYIRYLVNGSTPTPRFPMQARFICVYSRYLTLGDLDIDLQGHRTPTPRLPMHHQSICVYSRYLTLGDLDLDLQGHPSGWTYSRSMRWFQYFKPDSNPFTNNRAMILRRFRIKWYFPYFSVKIVLIPYK